MQHPSCAGGDIQVTVRREFQEEVLSPFRRRALQCGGRGRPAQMPSERGSFVKRMGSLSDEMQEVADSSELLSVLRESKRRSPDA